MSVVTGTGTRLVIDCESGEPPTSVEPPTEPAVPTVPVEPTQPTAPLEPIDPPGSDELLVNSDFSSQPTGWLACNNTSAVSIENNTAVIGSDECVHQGC